MSSFVFGLFLQTWNFILWPFITYHFCCWILVDIEVFQSTMSSSIHRDDSYIGSMLDFPWLPASECGSGAGISSMVINMTGRRVLMAVRLKSSASGESIPHQVCLQAYFLLWWFPTGLCKILELAITKQLFTRRWGYRDDKTSTLPSPCPQPQ